MRKVGLPGTPWSVKPSQQEPAKPHAPCCQAHAKLVPSKALFLPSWLWAPFLVWRKVTLPCQAIAPSILYIILICEKKTSPGRERGGILEFYLTDVVTGTGRNPGHLQTRVAHPPTHPSPPHPPEGGEYLFLCVLLFVLLRVAMT